MLSETIVIAGSAASMGFVHTILGPDHYLPLVAMAKTNGCITKHSVVGRSIVFYASHALCKPQALQTRDQPRTR